jgi:DNA-binding Xre family transcriptional regulator
MGFSWKFKRRLLFSIIFLSFGTFFAVIARQRTAESMTAFILMPIFLLVGLLSTVLTINQLRTELLIKKAIKNKEVIARFTVSKKELKKENIAKFKLALTSNFSVVIIICVMLAFIFIPGIIFTRIVWDWVFSFFVVVAALFSGAFLIAIIRLINIKDKETIICKKMVFIDNKMYSWFEWGSNLEEVVIERKPMLALKFTYSFIGRKHFDTSERSENSPESDLPIVSYYTFSVPLPKNGLGLAEKIIRELKQDKNNASLAVDESDTFDNKAKSKKIGFVNHAKRVNEICNKIDRQKYRLHSIPPIVMILFLASILIAKTCIKSSTISPRINPLLLILSVACFLVGTIIFIFLNARKYRDVFTLKKAIENKELIAEYTLTEKNWRAFREYNYSIKKRDKISTFLSLSLFLVIAFAILFFIIEEDRFLVVSIFLGLEFILFLFAFLFDYILFTRVNNKIVDKLMDFLFYDTYPIYPSNNDFERPFQRGETVVKIYKNIIVMASKTYSWSKKNSKLEKIRIIKKPLLMLEITYSYIGLAYYSYKLPLPKRLYYSFNVPIPDNNLELAEKIVSELKSTKKK